ncbi:MULTISPECIES: metalloregulator ArsR/SmtB family transcription factor [unclassified Rudaea]|uniref:ArsR/SmtB family transcription factor n=1 Tax=unclassified Rudaea TaxID=2627037 RepID=UPI0020165760|nr:MULTISPECIES: metalloregulator ArsR/SmtB family transcription factor [unclassified Rudaea]
MEATNGLFLSCSRPRMVQISRSSNGTFGPTISVFCRSVVSMTCAEAVETPLRGRLQFLILNHMVHCYPAHFNASFAALADATRRGVLDQLARGDASITDLADKFEMTLTGMKKHVGVLEMAGLVTTEKVGRVRTCRIGPCRLEEEMEWIARYRQVWDARFEALDGVIDELKRQEKARGRKKRK